MNKLRNLLNFGDENYLLDLCDEILGQKALRQHLFDLPDKKETFPYMVFIPN